MIPASSQSLPLAIPEENNFHEEEKFSYKLNQKTELLELNIIEYNFN